jgi:hypothetical protein
LKKKRLKKHSPIKRPPLRVPGQSLDEKIFDQALDGGLAVSIPPVFLTVMALLEWYRWWREQPPAPVLLTLAAVTFWAWSSIKFPAHRRRIIIPPKNWTAP